MWERPLTFHHSSFEWLQPLVQPPRHQPMPFFGEMGAVWLDRMFPPRKRGVDRLRSVDLGQREIQPLSDGARLSRQLVGWTVRVTNCCGMRQHHHHKPDMLLGQLVTCRPQNRFQVLKTVLRDPTPRESLRYNLQQREQPGNRCSRINRRTAR